MGTMPATAKTATFQYGISWLEVNILAHPLKNAHLPHISEAHAQLVDSKCDSLISVEVSAHHVIQKDGFAEMFFADAVPGLVLNWNCRQFA